MSEKDIQEAIAPLVAEVFTPGVPSSYQILVKVRSNDTFDRMRVIQSIAGAVGREHPVDFTHPDVVIIAEAVKVCAVPDVPLSSVVLPTTCHSLHSYTMDWGYRLPLVSRYYELQSTTVWVGSMSESSPRTKRAD